MTTSSGEKLKGFPHVYYINMDSNTARNDHIKQHMESYGINSYERVPGVTATQTEMLKYVHPKYFERVHGTHIPISALGCTVAHLMAIKAFAESEYDEAVIVEDDVDFTLTKYWNFTWEDVYSRLPNDWQLVQLARTYMDAHVMKMSILNIRRWNFLEYGSVAYLIKKQRALELVDFYFTKGNLVRGKLAGRAARPLADDIMYTFSDEGTYSLNLMYSNNGKVSSSNIHVNHEPIIQVGMDILEYSWANNVLSIDQLMEIK